MGLVFWGSFLSFGRTPTEAMFCLTRCLFYMFLRAVSYRQSPSGYQRERGATLAWRKGVHLARTWIPNGPPHGLPTQPVTWFIGRDTSRFLSSRWTPASLGGSVPRVNLIRLPLFPFFRLLSSRLFSAFSLTPPCPLSSPHSSSSFADGI